MNTHLDFGRKIYAVDVGTTRCQKSNGQPNFGWTRVDPEMPEGIFGSSSIELLSAWLVEDLTERRSVALGFEAPLFIPVPTASSDLSHGRTEEGNRSWAAGPGLTVATLGLHQAAWILKFIQDRCCSSVDFQLAHHAWPPTGAVTTLFCWEAFVSADAKSPSSHIGDAATAAMEFVDKESGLADATVVRAERPLSLIGAAALWSGLAVDPKVLHEPTVVLKPCKPFEGDWAEAGNPPHLP